ncbi:F0F1 ATP synthase subunit B [soil metagenome]
MVIEHALLFAQEHEETREGLDLILPPAAELFGGAIAFAIVVFALMKFALPKLRETIEARQNEIEGNLQDAEAAKAEAQGSRDEYKQQLAEARSEANRIIEEARQQAEEVRKDVVAKAEKDAEAVMARAQEQIEAERGRALSELRTTISTVSIELAEKVVGRTIDASAQKELVDAYINEVSSMSPTGGRNN